MDAVEVHPGLFVGSELDEQAIRGTRGWFVIHACKEPYHREALGYIGRAAPITHPEYLTAARPGRLILNLIDADDASFVSHDLMETAIEAIRANIDLSYVLVHCNKGVSRSPSIALLYLIRHTSLFDDCASIEEAILAFRKIYPAYYPARGMADYVRQNWSTI